jgi:hypothetical protein
MKDTKNKKKIHRINKEIIRERIRNKDRREFNF